MTSQPTTVVSKGDITTPNFLLIASACSFAADAHKNQRRKELGDPYINHPIRVAQRAAMIGFPAWFIAACYLHDVIEDCNVTEKTIRNAFPEDTANLVVAMSKWWDEGTQTLTEDIRTANYAAYYKRLMETPGGMNLKFLDRADNLSDFVKVAQVSPKAHRWAENYLKKTDVQFTELYQRAEGDIHPTVKALFDGALASLRMECR